MDDVDVAAVMLRCNDDAAMGNEGSRQVVIGVI
jgi:hypothetical protein